MSWLYPLLIVAVIAAIFSELPLLAPFSGLFNVLVGACIVTGIIILLKEVLRGYNPRRRK